MTPIWFQALGSAWDSALIAFLACLAMGNATASRLCARIAMPRWFWVSLVVAHCALAVANLVVALLAMVVR